MNTKARYVKVNMTYGSAGNYAHIKDFKVYGKQDINPTHIPVNGLKGYWNFNEGAGTAAADTSGNGNNGTITGATWTTAGKNDGALYFDGNDDNVALAQTTDIPMPWTASMWVRREDSTNSTAVFMSSANSSLRLEQYNGTNKVGFTIPGTGDFSFNYQAAIDEWVHLAFVGTNNGTSLYVNGMYKQFLPIVISCPMSTIGRSTFALKGTLDEVRVYDRDLGASEIRILAGIAPSADTVGVTRALISQEKPATASNTEFGSSPANANDGSKNTYWGGVKSPDTRIAWLQLDLENSYYVSEVNVRNYVDGTRYYNYYVTASMDGINWTPIGENSGATPAGDTGDIFSGINMIARYLRVNLTNNSVDPYSVHISEFRVYGS